MGNGKENCKTFGFDIHFLNSLWGCSCMTSYEFKAFPFCWVGLRFYEVFSNKKTLKIVYGWCILLPLSVTSFFNTLILLSNLQRIFQFSIQIFLFFNSLKKEQKYFILSVVKKLWTSKGFVSHQTPNEWDFFLFHGSFFYAASWFFIEGIKVNLKARKKLQMENLQTGNEGLPLLFWVDNFESAWKQIKTRKRVNNKQ